MAVKLRATTPAPSALLAAILALGLTACGASAEPGRATVAAAPTATTTTPSPARTVCGPAAPEVLARAAGMVAARIYAEELTGSETRIDQRQVEGFAPLLSALAAGNRAAVNAAVISLVYSHTHVVRLRVSRGATVLADVGGPHILAPVSGTLRLHGRTVGHYVLSVQDDVGYVKLVTRFVGVPLIMRAGSTPIPVEGLLAPGPASVPDHGPVTYRGVEYEAFSFNARSFPGGPLRISLLVPVPGSLSARSCAVIKSAELGRVAQLISRRFKLSPASFSAYIKLVRTLTGGLIYIRAGTRQLAGSTRPAPRRLPSSGPVSYAGRSYEVSSFLAPTSVGQVRIYQLLAA
jgi:hypothetical protein